MEGEAVGESGLGPVGRSPRPYCAPAPAVRQPTAATGTPFDGRAGLGSPPPNRTRGNGAPNHQPTTGRHAGDDTAFVSVGRRGLLTSPPASAVPPAAARSPSAPGPRPRPTPGRAGRFPGSASSPGGPGTAGRVPCTPSGGWGATGSCPTCPSTASPGPPPR